MDTGKKDTPKDSLSGCVSFSILFRIPLETESYALLS